MSYRNKLLQRIQDNGNKTLSDDQLLEFSREFIKELKSKKSFKLYRYVPFNYNNMRSIETSYVYLSEIGKMNDVFEGLTLSDPTGKIDFKDLHDLLYLKSFSEDKDNLLMWSHYADNHKGMCIEYDLVNILNQVYENKVDSGILYHLFPVVYLENRVDDKEAVSNLKYAAKSIGEYKYDLNNNNCHADTEWHEDIKSMFLIKSKNWEYEKEWRVAVTFTQINEDSKDVAKDKADLYQINNQNIFFDCITSIYCGANLDKDKIKHVEEIVTRLNNNRSDKIYTYECKLHSSEYKLTYQLT